MRYSIADVKRIYDFFDRDFFLRKFGKKLGKAEITIEKPKAEAWFGEYDLDEVSGLSLVVDGKKRLYINRFLLDNLKPLANTIIHEMIHLYDQEANPHRRSYRKGHGSFWTKVASLANDRYERRLGKIEQYSSELEVAKMRRSKLIHSTKSLSNAYIVILQSGAKAAIKSLNAVQIERIKHTSAIAVYRIHPNLSQSKSNRVKKFLNFNKLLETIEANPAALDELDIDLNKQADAIFTKLLVSL